MKKVITILLSIIMVVSMVACGGQNETTEQHKESTAATEQTETGMSAVEETAQPEEATEPMGTEAPTEPEAELSRFDTSWAANDFEKLIPQPPFGGWTGNAVSDNVYEMETVEANADEATNANGGWLYYDIWAEYVQTLADCGFAMEGDAYKASGTDDNGVSVELMCGDGCAWITITKP